MPSLHPEEYASSLQPESAAALKHISIRNFRGIDKLDISFSRALTVIYGKNGSGKTSIFHAIEWGLLGRVETLARAEEFDANVYRYLFAKGGTSVSLAFVLDGKDRLLRRQMDESGDSRTFVDGKEVSDDTPYLQVLVGSRFDLAQPSVIRRLIRENCFLSQGTLRDFASEKPEQRYDSFTELLGTRDYSKYLEKISRVCTLLSLRSSDLQTELNRLALEIKDTGAKISSRERLLSGTSVAQSLEDQKRYTFRQLSVLLSALQSPVVAPTALGSVEDIEAFLAVLKAWQTEFAAELSDKLQRIAFMRGSVNSMPERIARVAALGAEKHAQQSELAKLVEAVQKHKGDLARIATTTREIDAGIRQAESEIARLLNLQRVRTEISKITAERSQHQGTEAALQETLQNSKSQSEQLSKQADTINGQLRAFRAQVEELSRRQLQLRAVEEQAAVWQDLVARRASLHQTQADLTNALKTAETTLLNRREDLSRARAELQEAENQVRRESEALKTQSGLLSQLISFVNGPSCPLCGHQWESMDELRNHIDAKLSILPAYIRESAEHRRKTERHVEQLAAEIKTLEAQAGAYRNESEDGRHKLADMEEKFARGLEAAQIAGFSTSVYEHTELLEDAKRLLSDSVATLRARQENTEKSLAKALQERDAVQQRVYELETAVQRAVQSLRNADSKLRQLQNSVQAMVANGSDVGISDNLTKAEGQVGDLRDKHAELGRQRTDLTLMLSAEETREAELRKRLSDLEASISELEAMLQTTRSALSQLGLLPSITAKDLDEFQHTLETQEQSLALISVNAEKARHLASYLTAEKELRELHDQLSAKRIEQRTLETSIRRQQGWIKHFEALADEISRAKSELEESHWADYRPTINLLYQRISSHPVFGSVTADIDDENRMVHLHMGVSEHLPQAVTTKWANLTPKLFLNEAQLNVFALSMFLANKVQQKWARSLPLFLDDPVQTMDSLNANSFADTIRSFVSHDQQVILATCDLQLYKLMMLKFSCLNSCTPDDFGAVRLEGDPFTGSREIEDKLSIQ